MLCCGLVKNAANAGDRTDPRLLAGKTHPNTALILLNKHTAHTTMASWLLTVALLLVAATLVHGVVHNTDTNALSREAQSARDQELVANKYEVLLHDGSTQATVTQVMRHVATLHADSSLASVRGHVGPDPLHIVPAFELVDATPDMAERLAQNEHVRSVTPETVFHMAATANSWGQDRVDQATLPLDGTITTSMTGAGTAIYLASTTPTAS